MGNLGDKLGDGRSRRPVGDELGSPLYEEGHWQSTKKGINALIILLGSHSNGIRGSSAAEMDSVTYPCRLTVVGGS